MAELYALISNIAFIFAAFFFVAAVVCFFVLNVRGAYVELKCQKDRNWLMRRQRRRRRTEKKWKKEKKVQRSHEMERITGEEKATETMGNFLAVRKKMLSCRDETADKTQQGENKI